MGYKDDIYEMEKSLIGTIMLHPEWVDDVLIMEEYFTNDYIRNLYSTIVDRKRKRQTISPATIAMDLYSNEWARKMIEECVEKAYTYNKDFLYACDIRKNQYIKEELAKQAQIAVMDAPQLNVSAKDILGELSKVINSLYDELDNGSRFKNAMDAYTEFANEYTKIRMGDSDSPFLSTGFRGLDSKFRFTTGLYILAARPSMGKTALALMFAKHVAEHNPVLFFSLEMSCNELLMRYASSTIQESEMRRKLHTYKFNVSELSLIQEKLPLENIYIDDSPKSVDEIESIARKMYRKEKCSMVIVDHITLIDCKRDKNGRRDLEIADITKRCKMLAKELKIPVLLLSQLNRDCTGRNDKKPMLNDLRESGAIEQDADIVMMLHRPEYYGQNTYNTQSGETLDAEKLGVLIVNKNRNGKVGETYLKFNEDFSSAEDFMLNNKQDYQPINFHEPRYEQEDSSGLPF